MKSIDGVGVMTYPDGKVFEGTFKKGVKEGKGRLVHPNGAYY